MRNKKFTVFLTLFNKSNSAKQSVSPGRKVKGFAFSVMAALILSLTSIVQVRATTPIPLGWTTVYAPLPPNFPGVPGQGVKVLSKKNNYGYTEYVTIVDMRYATLRSFTGEVSGRYYDSQVKRISQSTYWSRAVTQNTNLKKAVAVINGTFFDSTPGHDPSSISFGLESDWWIMSYGYGVGDNGGRGAEDPGKIRQFLFDTSYGSSSIQLYNRNNFYVGVPNVIGGLDITSTIKNPNGLIKRTMVGVRDDNNDTKSETVIFFTSPYATQAQAANTLSAFGCGSKMVLDSGSSTGFVLNGGTPRIVGNPVPQAFVIYNGR